MQCRQGMLELLGVKHHRRFVEAAINFDCFSLHLVREWCAIWIGVQPGYATLAQRDPRHTVEHKQD